MGQKIEAGRTQKLKIARLVKIGAYLDDGGEGLLLPLRFLPENAQVSEDIEVFVYHDGEDRLIATTQKPKAQAGEIAKLKVVSLTPIGAFLDNGLMKDLFIPKSQMVDNMRINGEYLVRVHTDEKTGRMVATQKFMYLLENADPQELYVKQEVKLTALRRTDIGYVMAIDDKYLGVLHSNEIYRPIHEGATFRGFVKNITEDGKINVAAGTAGYARVEDESEKILRLLAENNGYLPYHDKSDPEDIYEFFGMSKKTFKMALGRLYREKKISLEKSGIKLI